MCFTQYQDVAFNAQLNNYNPNLETVPYQQNWIVDEEYENVQPDIQPNVQPVVQPNVQQVFQPLQAVPVQPTRPIGRSGKPKRYRTNFTGEQLSEMENRFKTDQYLSRSERIEMAQKMDLDERQVKVWFQNRRMKYKRENNASKSGRLSVKNSLSSDSPRPSSSSSPPSYELDTNENNGDHQIRTNLLQYQQYGYVDNNTFYRPCEPNVNEPNFVQMNNEEIHKITYEDVPVQDLSNNDLIQGNGMEHGYEFVQLADESQGFNNTDGSAELIDETVNPMSNIFAKDLLITFENSIDLNAEVSNWLLTQEEEGETNFLNI